ncbi:MAG: CBS domain-containing protein [Candidatus Aenigmarchaeota archaeon]|nr:CBS domain-containing protein [Candidatus Aenigmarchaeota archaeon]
MAMLIKDVMNRNVIATKPGVSVREAAKIMSKYHIGSLVVLEENKIIGILTEGDILRKVIAQDKDLDETKIREIMTQKVVTINSDKTIEDAVNLMMENRIKKLPVVDDDKLVGVITASDIMVVEPKLIEAISNLISLKIPGYRGG